LIESRLIRGEIVIIEIYINCGYVGHQTSQERRECLFPLLSPEDLLLESQAEYQVRLVGVSDCTFMQLRSYSLTPNIFLHNIRELLEKMAISE
jgi:hypothetical protein